MNVVTTNGWVRSDDAMAEEFSVYLEQNCDWSLDDFGGDYPWGASVPARDQWESEVEKFNQRLATLTR